MARTEREGAQRLVSPRPTLTIQVEDVDEQKDDNESRDKIPQKPLRFYTLLDMVLGRKYNPVQSSLPSALTTARAIEDISNIAYPEGIMSPKAELNVNAKQGNFGPFYTQTCPCLD